MRVPSKVIMFMRSFLVNGSILGDAQTERVIAKEYLKQSLFERAIVNRNRYGDVR
jgi:hypothetical protein